MFSYPKKQKKNIIFFSYVWKHVFEVAKNKMKILLNFLSFQNNLKA